MIERLYTIKKAGKVNGGPGLLFAQLAGDQALYTADKTKAMTFTDEDTANEVLGRLCELTGSDHRIKTFDIHHATRAS